MFRPLRGVLIVGVAVCLTPWAYSELLPSDPLSAVPCSSCHLTSSSQVRTKEAHLLIAPQEQLCARCHSGALQASHPSGLDPSMPVPKEFPLDWKGDLTCSSCHWVHEGGHGIRRSALTGQAYCQRCHEQAFFTAMSDGGKSLIRSGHLDASPSVQDLAIDTYSQQCLTCHQGKRAMTMGMDRRGIARHGGGAINHPVGGLYEDAVSFGGYRPITQLPRHIALPSGRVSCISCHQAYSQQHGELVQSNLQSRLCFQCHDL